MPIRGRVARIGSSQHDIAVAKSIAYASCLLYLGYKKKISNWKIRKRLSRIKRETQKRRKFKMGKTKIITEVKYLKRESLKEIKK